LTVLAHCDTGAALALPMDAAAMAATKTDAIRRWMLMAYSRLDDDVQK
jgi:hypothetical protein